MKSLLCNIQKVLSDLGVSEWILTQTDTETAELFFIKHALDMRRMKKVTKYKVAVYCDFEKDGKTMKGSSSVEIVPAQSEEEIKALIEKAYFAASFVANPTYKLPEKVTCALKESDSDIAKVSVGDAAMTMAKAMFAGETKENKAFINSGEIFAEKHLTRILSSCGTDVSYVSCNVNGELVVQCKEPEDVEMFRSFEYDSLNTEALTTLVKESLKQVEDRAYAKKELPSGNYDVILSGEQLAELLSFYPTRTAGSMVYPGYSTWKVGDGIQGEDIVGEKLSIIGWAKEPFDAQGIPMEDRPLVEDGKVSLIHCDARSASYLNAPMTGMYQAIKSENGSVPFADMKKNCLYPVTFSDFQMDAFSGFFGGEIRLAYLYDGENVKIVTGGSISGNIAECGNDLVFSLERYSGADYQGPFAVKLKNVKVAGTI